MPDTSTILYAMAAEAEYGPHLKALITPLMTGVGPVEAGVAMAAVLAERKAACTLPKLVISLGSAGSARLEQTGIYQATSVSYRDMDASPLGVEKGRTPFLDLPATLAMPLRVPGLPTATLSTGADIVSGARYATIAEDMVDMESYAILRACQRYSVPLIVVRGISDGAHDVNHIDDWTRYLHIIDRKLADAVVRIENARQAGHFPGV